MPRKSSPSAPKRRAAAKATFSDTPRLISDEEKRELIRVHAAARGPQDPLQRMSLWAGVTFSVVGIAFGWWFTVGHELKQTAMEGNTHLKQMTQELNEFADRVDESRLPFMEPSTSQASAGSFEDTLRSNLGGATRTRDLLSPPDAQAAPSDASASSTAAVPPGLTPDAE